MKKQNSITNVESKKKFERDEKSPLSSFEMNLEKAKELKSIENPDSILGPWFLVHKV